MDLQGRRTGENIAQKGYAKIFWRILRNRGGYTDKEIARLHETKWAHGVAEISKSFYWFRVEMVKTNRCTVGWKQGDCIYFDSLGMLMKRKCPKSICPHAIASISPVIYSCLDRMGRGADPSKMQVEYVSCTDPGFDHKGLGNNLMKVTYERMPLHEYVRTTMGLTLTPHLFFRSSRARGPNPGGFE